MADETHAQFLFDPRDAAAAAAASSSVNNNNNKQQQITNKCNGATTQSTGQVQDCSKLFNNLHSNRAERISWWRLSRGTQYGYGMDSNVEILLL
jgi:hypothetical protein